MTRNGDNAIAFLSVLCATVLTALGTTDREIPMALVVLAGTAFSGRGQKA